MWLAVAILGVLAIAAGVSILPGGLPAKAPPPSATAASNPYAPGNMPSEGGGQH